MRKILCVLVFSFLLLALSTATARASFVTITKNGEIVWNVLASSNIEVKNTAIAADISRLSLRSESGKFYLNDIDVTSLSDQELVDIEERPEARRIAIGVRDGSFSLNEGGTVALTTYPIRVDAKERKLSVRTSTGDTFLAVLPKEAVEVAIRSRFISKNVETIYISNLEDEVVYKIDGEKIFDLLGVVSYSVPMTAYVSVSSGKIINIIGPEWFKIFGFLFA